MYSTFFGLELEKSDSSGTRRSFGKALEVKLVTLNRSKSFTKVVPQLFSIASHHLHVSLRDSIPKYEGLRTSRIF
jgi:hypothetical protein